jgi:protocatechuate 3,4-dioxygenase beta subunit
MANPFALALLVGALLAAPSAAQGSGTGCPATAADMLGPFYVAGAPERSTTGDGLVVQGTVRSTRDCTPLSGARVEWWSANGRGEYDAAHRATQITGADGGFRYVTDRPGRYPGRPPHVHVKVTAKGHKSLVTQVYPKPSENSIGFDLVLQPE